MDQEVAVPGDQGRHPGGDGAGEELVVRIGGHWRTQRRRFDDVALNGEEREEGLEIDSWMVGGEDAADALVLVHDLGGEHELDRAVAPSIEDAPGIPPKKTAERKTLVSRTILNALRGPWPRPA